MPRSITFVLMLALALLLVGVGHAMAGPAAQADLPPAPIVDDEGGPKRLTGSLDYTDFAIQLIMQNPAPALIDMVHVVQGDKTQFAPVASQILGRMTAPVFPPPLRYAFDLPAEPRVSGVEIDLGFFVGTLVVELETGSGPLDPSLVRLGYAAVPATELPLVLIKQPD